MDLAKELNPTYVVPKDYYHDPQQTIKSVLEFIDMYKSDNIIIPLQPNDSWDYTECLTALGSYGKYFAIGGVAYSDDITQFQVINKTVPLVAKYGKVHLFGIFPSRWVGNTSRETPIWNYLHGVGKELVESMDSINCESAAITGEIFDLHMRRVPFDTTGELRNVEVKLHIAALSCWCVQIALNGTKKRSLVKWGGNLKNLKVI